jgi:4-hydroxybenzoate polyprenyltransferase
MREAAWRFTRCGAVLRVSTFELLSSFVIRHLDILPGSSMNPPSRLRTLLVLGRVSNLPTVWSNCLAAWWLGGGGRWERFAVLCAGASLLYTAGMFLNDAFDADFDRRYRAERPIPSGQISPRAVWSMAWACLVAGWLAIIALGTTAGILAAGLVACIVVYDAIHKRTALAPLVMAACRFLLYSVAASVAQSGVTQPLIWRAAALALYITGISYLARGESGPAPVRAWPIGLLFVPVILAVMVNSAGGAVLWAVATIAAAWVLWCLRGGFMRSKRPLARGVGGLLAGIVLVDWLAAVAGGQGSGVVFVLLFVLALVSQRVAPAT